MLNVRTKRSAAEPEGAVLIVAYKRIAPATMGAV
jgi:hypothetical protein